MTDTTERVAPPSASSAGRGGRTGLGTMNVVELKRLASGLGITGTTKMRKDDLVAVITARQAGSPTQAPRREDAVDLRADGGQPAGTEPQQRSQDGGRPAETPAPQRTEPVADRAAQDGQTGDESDRSREQQNRDQSRDTQSRNTQSRNTRSRDQQSRDQNRSSRPGQQPGQPSGAQGGGPSAQSAQPSAPQSAQPSAQQSAQEEDDGRGGRRRSRQRSRDRKRGRTPTTGSQEYEPELQINDDDVLVPVAGILDVLDNYAFVRTSGYLPGPNDVYVPLGLVKKYGLRKGDAVTGSIKAPREGEQPQNGAANRQKFSALVRLDSINGAGPDLSRNRVEFGKLTPLYSQERLRLETEVGQLTTRVIDLVAPVGKGQRALLAAPAEAGTTMVLQAIANAITANNPECHLMVVLVDERPEEVTDMQRAVKGEVIASTFDRPAEDHTTVAELSIERAKRLVELGHDVVLLLDSITKLGRAYNLSAPASGRIVLGGLDSSALYPPKKFFGAARNIENGGSLTIIATAQVDTGSPMDEVIFEELKGTGNMELKLSRELADRRIFPAVDVFASGTRREEILLGPEELKIVWKLRRVLGALDPQQSIELLLDRLKRTRTNIEFLRQVQMSSSTKLDTDD